MPTLEVRDVYKHFGHVTALNGVTLALYSGEVVALVGDNGAGKSTLVSILTGLLQPDAGGVYLQGRPVRIPNPARAQALGIATVFQDLALVDERDVAANLFAGREPRRFGLLVDRRRMVREATHLISNLKVSLPSVHTLVRDLSGGQRQATAIVRALMGRSLATLLDEPTAALGVREAGRVLELVQALRFDGQAVLLISHNLETVFQFADRIVVMRLGRVLADFRADDTTRQHVVGLLTGAVVNNP